MCGLLQANIMFVDKYLPGENIAIFLASPEIESRRVHYIACIININVVRFELYTIGFRQDTNLVSRLPWCNIYFGARKYRYR